MEDVKRVMNCAKGCIPIHYILLIVPASSNTQLTIQHKQVPYINNPVALEWIITEYIILQTSLLNMYNAVLKIMFHSLQWIKQCYTAEKIICITSS